MKPNILVIDSAMTEPTPAVVDLATRLARHSYVYLICPGCGFREDTPEGVRFLSHDPTAPPEFGQLDGVVTFVHGVPIATLRRRYPAVPVFREPRAAQVAAILQAATAYRARLGARNSFRLLMSVANATRTEESKPCDPPLGMRRPSSFVGALGTGAPRRTLPLGVQMERKLSIPKGK
jgi:hypothetical protein